MSARTFVGLLAVSLAVIGCEPSTFIGTPGLLTPPANLRYALDPSGDPDRPAGIL